MKVQEKYLKAVPSFLKLKKGIYLLYTKYKELLKPSDFISIIVFTKYPAVLQR